MSKTKRKALKPSQDVELRLAKAMAHPVRVKALELLSREPMAPVDVSNATGVPVSNMGYHFRTLLELGCVEKVGEEQKRGSIKTTYRSTVDLMVSRARWSGIEGKAMREMQQAILRAIATRVADAVDAKTFERREDIQNNVATVAVTEEEWTEVADMIQAVTDRIVEIGKEPAGESHRFPATFALQAYESPTMYEA